MKANKNPDNEGIRLAKFLAQCGLGSRRKCEELILAGKIKIGENIITDLSVRIKNTDRVFLNEKQVVPEKKIVLAFNKPEGYLSTTKDDFGREVVTDFVKDLGYRLYPAGRLDKNSRGLMVLTNNGELVQKIIHPKFKITKTYEVAINRYITDEDIHIIKKGINIEGRPVVVRGFSVFKRTDGYSKVMIGISEGRKRIIRRMFKSIGFKVTDLKRIKIGNFKLANIKPGEYKFLTDREINKLIEL